MPTGEDLAVLRERAAALRAAADAADRVYEHTAWIKFVAVFVPVPFVVLLFRLQIDASGYHVAGGLFVAVALAVMVLDWRAVARRDAAARAADVAEKTYADAREAKKSS